MDAAKGSPQPIPNANATKAKRDNGVSKAKAKAKLLALRATKKGKENHSPDRRAIATPPLAAIAKNPAMKPVNAANVYTTRNKNPPPP